MPNLAPKDDLLRYVKEIDAVVELLHGGAPSPDGYFEFNRVGCEAKLDAVIERQLLSTISQQRLLRLRHMASKPDVLIRIDRNDEEMPDGTASRDFCTAELEGLRRRLIAQIDAIPISRPASERLLLKLSSLIPRKHRSHLMHDLWEDVSEFRQEGYTERRLCWMVLWQFSIIVGERLKPWNWLKHGAWLWIVKKFVSGG